MCAVDAHVVIAFRRLIGPVLLRVRRSGRLEDCLEGGAGQASN
jgi:hypothetical protein